MWEKITLKDYASKFDLVLLNKLEDYFDSLEWIGIHKDSESDDESTYFQYYVCSKRTAEVLFENWSEYFNYWYCDKLDTYFIAAKILDNRDNISKVI